MITIDDLIVDDPRRMVWRYIADTIDGLNRHEWRIAFYKTAIGEKLARGDDVRTARKLLAESKRAEKAWHAHLMAYIGMLRCLDTPKDIAAAALMPALSSGMVGGVVDRKTNLRVIEEALGDACGV